MATWERFVYTGKGSRDSVATRYKRMQGIQLDLYDVRQLIGAIESYDIYQGSKNPMMDIESLWIALVVKLVRCFEGTPGGQIVFSQIPGLRGYETEYDVIKLWRDKHLAHPSDTFQTTEITFHINDETGAVAGPNYGASSPLTPPVDLASLKAIVGNATAHVEQQIALEGKVIAKRVGSRKTRVLKR